MQLIETLVAGCILAGSGASSLQIMALHLQTSLQDSQLQMQADLLEDELTAIESSLQPQVRSLSWQADCSLATSELQRLLASRPLAADLRLQLKPLAAGDGLQLELTSADQPWIRRRILRPAALGLCGPGQSPLTSPVGG